MKKRFLLVLVLFVALLCASYVFATDYYVSTTGDDTTGDGSSGKPWKTIQHAIDTVIAGDTINVADGTYNEQVIINKNNLVIQSISGAATTIIDVTGMGTSYGGIIFSGDGNTFSGFTVKDFSDESYENKIIRIDGDNNIIQNNIIQGNLNQVGVSDQTEYGILCYGSGNLIDSNEIYNIGYHGINVVYSDASSNTISNNNIHDIGMRAIAIDRAPNNIVTQNTISNLVGGTLWGSYYDPSVWCWGVIVWGASSAGTTIDDQDVTNLPNGIALSATHNVIVQNSEIAYNGIGIKLADSDWVPDSSDNNLIQYNEIHDNTEGIVIVVMDDGIGGIGTGNSINFNKIYNNPLPTTGLHNYMAQEIDAEYNWWGDPSGPYHVTLNPGGQGDTIIGNVDFTPWLECLNDDDCNFLDNDYCEGDFVKHDEGRCVDSVCTTETTTTQDCNNLNNDYCVGTEIKHDDYTCNVALCVLDSTTTIQDCDNGMYCDGQETCNNAMCVDGTDVDCSYLTDQCNNGVCDEGSDSCIKDPTYYEGLSCNDGLFCNEGETCQSGLCIGGSAKDCSDGIGCTVDSCDEANDECGHATNDELCPVDTLCANYYCDAALDCQVNYAPPTTICRAAVNDCDKEEYCDGIGDTCPDDLKQPDGTICDDGFSCTIEDQCTAGVCGGTPNNYLCDIDKLCNPLMYPQPTGCGEFITLTSPEDMAYSERKLMIGASTDIMVDEIGYSLDGGRFIRLCRNCMSYSTYKWFGDGAHNIVIKATMGGKTGSRTVDFFVDSREPRIIQTLPEDEEIVSGTTFTIRYTEDNLDKILLYWKRSAETEYSKVELDDCLPGRNKECSIDIDLSAYDGEDIDYYFEVYDPANTVASEVKTITIDSTNPGVTVNSPQEGVTYPERRILLNVSVDETVKTLEYSLDGVRFRRLCKDCNSYERIRSFDEGFNTLTIKAMDEAGNEGYATVNFIVDSKKPKISKIEPKDGSYVKGSDFTVYYDEDSVREVSLFYGTEGSMIEHVMDYCPSGRRQECTATVDLSGYDGQVIQYYFVVRSYLYEDTSDVYSVTVDDTLPEITINSPEPTTYNNRRIMLDIDLREKVEILEMSLNGGTFRRLCSRCDSYSRTRYFNWGENTIDIRATDYAGNQVTESVSFTITPGPP